MRAVVNAYQDIGSDIKETYTSMILVESQSKWQMHRSNSIDAATLA